MRTGLTKKQKTTMIYFDEQSRIIEVQTHNTDLKKRLMAFAAKHPQCSRRVTQIAGVIFLAYGLCPKLAYILSGIPRSVIGAVFLISAATIMFSGIDSIISDKRSLRNTLVAGTTLALAIMLPYHCASTYSAWAKSLPAFLNMLCTSTVFIAVVAGVLLNLILNYVLKDKNEK